MSLPKKQKIGQTEKVSAQRIFTDREEYQESFIKALADIKNNDLNILNFYGVGGVGKSRLQQHLKEEHLNKNSNAIYSWLDFEESKYRLPYIAFRTLAENFMTKFKISFTIFDIAYLIYLSKAFPEYEIKKEGLPFIKEGSLLSSAISIAYSTTGGIAGTVINTLDYLYNKSKEFSYDSTIRGELNKLKDLSSEEIEDELGKFFAYDIDQYIKNNPEKKVIIFLDTYEALWRENSSDENIYIQDEWIRNHLIANLPETLFVICGREKIAWADYEKEWNTVLNQHILGNLSEKDSLSFLNNCNIKEIDIQKNIFKASDGYPFYLDLCVDTYLGIKENGQIPNSNDFNYLNTSSIFNRFMLSINTSEIKTNILYTLSHARFYNKDIWDNLLGHKYSYSDLKRINDFSFISEENGTFKMHNIMRDSLIESPKNAEALNTNTLLFEYYDKNLQNLEIKNINQTTIVALQEAFYHKSMIASFEELLIWFDKLYSMFFIAAKFKILKQLSETLENISHKFQGEGNILPTIIAAKFSAPVYINLGLLENAETILLSNIKNLENFEKDDFINVSLQSSYLVLGELYLIRKDYIKSEKFINKSLEYNEKENPINIFVYKLLEKIYTETENIDMLKLNTQNILNLMKSNSKDNTKIDQFYNQMSNLLEGSENFKTDEIYDKMKNIIKETDLTSNDNNITIQYNLAKGAAQSNNFVEAEKIYKDVLNTSILKFGDNSPFVAKIYEELGDLYYQFNNLDEAELNYLKTIEISESIFGSENHQFITSYRQLGHILYEKNSFEDAKNLWEKVFNIYEKTYGENHTHTIEMMGNLAHVYTKLNKFNDAQLMYQKLIIYYEETSGKEDTNTAIYYNDLGEIYKKIKKFEDAEIMYFKAIKVFKKNLGNEHEYTIYVNDNINQLYKEPDYIASIKNKLM